MSIGDILRIIVFTVCAVVTINNKVFAKDTEINLSNIDPMVVQNNSNRSKYYKSISLNVGDKVTVIAPRKTFKSKYGQGRYTHGLVYGKSKERVLTDGSLSPNGCYVALNPGEAAIDIHAAGPGMGIIMPLLLIKVTVSAGGKIDTKQMLTSKNLTETEKRILQITGKSYKEPGFYYSINQLEKMTTDTKLTSRERQLAQSRLIALGPHFNAWLKANPFDWKPYIYTTCVAVKSKNTSKVLIANLNKVMTSKLDSYRKFRLIQSISKALIRLEGKKSICYLAPALKIQDETIQNHIMGKLSDLTSSDWYKDRTRNSMYANKPWYYWWNKRSVALYGVRAQDKSPKKKTPTGR